MAKDDVPYGNNDDTIEQHALDLSVTGEHSARRSSYFTRRDRAGHWIYMHRADFIGVSVLVLLIFAFLSPALVDGGSFGGFDLDTGKETALGAGLFTNVHSVANGDAVSQMVSWNTLDWQMIHHGSFPLWNEYSVLGMPQFLNFESSVLSLPDLVSYAFPLQFAFLVVVAMKFLIASTGVYALCRVLGLRPSSATFAGVSFMFAGAFAGWITWPLSDVISYAGWLGAFALLAYRGPRGHRFVIPLAITVAFSIYGGFPEGNVMLALAFGVGIVVAGLALLAFRQRIKLLGIVDVIVAAIGGIGLAAPLWYAGQQVINVAHRQVDGNYVGLPVRGLSLLVAQGYFGLPTGSNAIFQLNRWNYYETVTYVGVIGLLMVVIALFGKKHRVAVIGLVVATLFCVFATYQPVAHHPFQDFINFHSPFAAIRFERMRTVTAFMIAMLAGIGIDEFQDRIHTHRAQRVCFIATGVTGLGVAYLVYISVKAHLKEPSLTQRFDSLLWPIGLVVLSIVICVVIAMTHTLEGERATRRVRRIVFSLAFLGQAGFLVFAGIGIPSYSNTFYGVTPAISKLQSIVGTSLVGLDGGNTTNVRSFHHIGFYPNVNLGYNIHLFAAHDPLIPAAYFNTWPIAGAGGTRGVGLFVPNVNTAALAERYGIAYVIATPGTKPPAGMSQVATLNGEPLFYVPNASQFSFATSPDIATVIGAADNGNGSWTMSVRASKPSKMILRVTALPGWHLTDNGVNVPLSTVNGVMESAVIPAGTGTLLLHYWPPRLSRGIHLAIAAGVIIVLWTLSWFLLGRFVRKRRRAPAGPSNIPVPAK